MWCCCCCLDGRGGVRMEREERRGGACRRRRGRPRLVEWGTLGPRESGGARAKPPVRTGARGPGASMSTSGSHAPVDGRTGGAPRGIWAGAKGERGREGFSAPSLSPFPLSLFLVVWSRLLHDPPPAPPPSTRPHQQHAPERALLQPLQQRAARSRAEGGRPFSVLTRRERGGGEEARGFPRFPRFPKHTLEIGGVARARAQGSARRQ